MNDNYNYNCDYECGKLILRYKKTRSFLIFMVTASQLSFSPRRLRAFRSVAAHFLFVFTMDLFLLGILNV